MLFRAATCVVLVSLLSSATLGAAPATRPAYGNLWTRDPGAGSMAADEPARDGQPVLRVEHRGTRDWALTGGAPLAVRADDIVDLSVTVKTSGAGDIALSATTYDVAGKPVEWMMGAQHTRDAREWQTVKARLIIPAGVVRIAPRLTGTGAATVWATPIAVARTGNLADLRGGAGAPAGVTLENAAIALAFDARDGAFAVTDRRTGRVWPQTAPSAGTIVLRARRMDARTLEAGLLHVPTGMELTLGVRLDGDAPEAVVTVAAPGALARPLMYPHPFATPAGTYLVVPMNEGISYPVDDASIPETRLVAYGGHGICMPFFGATDGAAGYGAILETPDDAAIEIRRGAKGGLLTVAPRWEAQKGQFGYARVVRYAFFDRGGHVAIAKRYRAHAAKTGLLRTLAEKRRDRPAIDLLVGAVNVWCWERDPAAVVKELRAAGIDRILWSNQTTPKQIAALNEMGGVLTSRYDIYQDVMDPAMFPRLRSIHRDWTTPGWPKDLMLGPGRDWIRGWEVEAKDGSGMIPCGVLCDRQAIPYAVERIGAELKTHAYGSRFLDTTTASPWRECYADEHPVTRSESKHWKVELLRVVSDRYKLVCGSETGHDAAVPACDYFEGMLSLGPYRVPDSGRDTRKIWDEVPANVAKFQLGHQYRLPLWELVYHDCCVAQWYWGDYNNKLPALWDKRDQFNALYGTPAMFMFDLKLWEKEKARFAQSYRATAPVSRATGYAEMTDHRFLTPDRAVQQTAFAGGVTVTVNFGTAPYATPDGTTLAPGAIHTAGLPTPAR